MKIIIENVEFSYDLGVRLLKLKYETCPFDELKDVWDSIKPLTFKDIASFANLEHRRVGMVCFGLDRLVKEIEPIFIDSQTIKKSTTWVDKNGEIITKAFDDTYELYKVLGKHFSNEHDKSWQKPQDCYFVKCKDTSTQREYLIWIEPIGVYNTNLTFNSNKIYTYSNEKITPIQAISWTIQTNVPLGNIEKIIRQGDCIMIKPNKMEGFLEEPRHLTEKEYKELLVAES